MEKKEKKTFHEKSAFFFSRDDDRRSPRNFNVSSIYVTTIINKVFFLREARMQEIFPFNLLLPTSRCQVDPEFYGILKAGLDDAHLQILKIAPREFPKCDAIPFL